MSYKYVEIESTLKYKIKLKIFLPEEEIKTIIIATHGFGGDKESTAISLLANKLIKNNIAVVAFDFPGHGKSEIEADKLTLNNCINDFESVEKYINKEYPNKKTGIFATSFGAYITLLKLAKEKDDNKYYSIVLRSPAICMNQIFENAFFLNHFSS